MLSEYITPQWKSVTVTFYTSRYLVKTMNYKHTKGYMCFLLIKIRHWMQTQLFPILVNLFLKWIAGIVLMLCADGQIINVSRKRSEPLSPRATLTESNTICWGARGLIYTWRRFWQRQIKHATNVSFTSSAGNETGKSSDIYPAMNHGLPRMMCWLFFFGMCPRILAE